MPAIAETAIEGVRRVRGKRTAAATRRGRRDSSLEGVGTKRVGTDCRGIVNRSMFAELS